LETEKKVPQNLEKIYDLDTSRFEEEYSNLPSSKKKILLNQLEQEQPEKGPVANLSQVFQDQSKFNFSMDAAINKFDKPKVVSLDLASAMKKANNSKYNEMPRQ
jgi:hypothetical protein